MLQLPLCITFINWTSYLYPMYRVRWEGGHPRLHLVLSVSPPYPGSRKLPRRAHGMLENHTACAEGGEEKYRCHRFSDMHFFKVVSFAPPKSRPQRLLNGSTHKLEVELTWLVPRQKHLSWISWEGESISLEMWRKNSYIYIMLYHKRLPWEIGFYYWRWVRPMVIFVIRQTSVWNLFRSTRFFSPSELQWVTLAILRSFLNETLLKLMSTTFLNRLGH